MPPTPILIKRIAVSMLIGLVIGLLLNEVTFYFLRETARPPQRVELVIPSGTAERVASGEAPLAIPDNMIFVLGDTLVVINQDVENHQLGQLWIPAGGSASMQLDTAEKYTYSCSFQPTSAFGIEVHEPLTWDTRLFGIVFSGLPMGVIIAIYSLAMPDKEKKNVPA
ncbi:MAG: hypothetical protein Fur002_26310 [Anaerolineales bacterium]